MNEKTLVSSLAMDLFRVAVGLNRKSFKMAARFEEEALKRHAELEELNISDEYLNKLLERMKSALESSKKDKEEDILVYSILLQNYAIYKLSYS